MSVSVTLLLSSWAQFSLSVPLGSVPLVLGQFPVICDLGSVILFGL